MYTNFLAQFPSLPYLINLDVAFVMAQKIIYSVRVGKKHLFTLLER